MLRRVSRLFSFPVDGRGSFMFNGKISTASSALRLVFYFVLSFRLPLHSRDWQTLDSATGFRLAASGPDLSH